MDSYQRSLFINIHCVPAVIFKTTNRKRPFNTGNDLFFIFLNELKLNKFLINLVLISSLISNLVAFEFLNPDVPNHASSAQFGFFIEKGYLIKDYEKRQLIGSEYEFHINNAILSIKTAWSEQAPNC